MSLVADYWPLWSSVLLSSSYSSRMRKQTVIIHPIGQEAGFCVGIFHTCRVLVMLPLWMVVFEHHFIWLNLIRLRIWLYELFFDYLVKSNLLIWLVLAAEMELISHNLTFLIDWFIILFDLKWNYFTYDYWYGDFGKFKVGYCYSDSASKHLWHIIPNQYLIALGLLNSFMMLDPVPPAKAELIIYV